MNYKSAKYFSPLLVALILPMQLVAQSSDPYGPEDNGKGVKHQIIDLTDKAPAKKTTPGNGSNGSSKGNGTKTGGNGSGSKSSSGNGKGSTDGGSGNGSSTDKTGTDSGSGEGEFPMSDGGDVGPAKKVDKLLAKYEDEEEIKDDVDFMLPSPITKRKELEDNPEFEKQWDELMRKQTLAYLKELDEVEDLDEKMVAKSETMSKLAKELADEQYNETVYPKNPTRKLIELEKTPKPRKDDEKIKTVSPEENASKYFQLKNRPAVREYIDDIRSGAGKLAPKITYNELEEVVKALQDAPADMALNSRYSDPTVVALLIDSESNTSRDKVMKGLTGLLENPDPRVRLVGLRFYRRLIPDMPMVKILLPYFKKETTGKDIAVQTKVPGKKPSDPPQDVLETKTGDKYTFIDLTSGDKLTAGAFAELQAILRFAWRNDLVRRMRQGEPNMLRTIKDNEFKIIAEPIAGEVDCALPMYWFYRDEIPFLMAGLTSGSDKVAKTCFDALVRIMRDRRTVSRERVSIMEILRGSRFQSSVIVDSDKMKANEVNNYDAVTGFLKSNGYFDTPCKERTDDRFDSPTGELYPKRNWTYKAYSPDPNDFQVKVKDAKDPTPDEASGAVKDEGDLNPTEDPDKPEMPDLEVKGDTPGVGPDKAAAEKAAADKADADKAAAEKDAKDTSMPKPGPSPEPGLQE